MFGPVVAEVSFAGSPGKFELFLCFMVSETIESMSIDLVCLG